MKRRTFISTLTALVSLPALPASAATSLSAGHVSQHFAKAKLLARCHDRASPEMFSRLMQLDIKTAQEVFNMLKARSVIAPGIDGITRAINPLNTHCIPNEAIKARDLAQMTRDVATRFQKMAQKRIEDKAQDECTFDTPPDANSIVTEESAPTKDGSPA